jgi:hypothetical protein
MSVPFIHRSDGHADIDMDAIDDRDAIDDLLQVGSQHAAAHADDFAATLIANALPHQSYSRNVEARARSIIFAWLISFPRMVDVACASRDLRTRLALGPYQRNRSLPYVLAVRAEISTTNFQADAPQC